MGEDVVAEGEGAEVGEVYASEVELGAVAEVEGLVEDESCQVVGCGLQPERW